MQRINLEKGARFGKLVVIEWKKLYPKRSGWLCLCDCGKETIVPSISLQNGRTKSCGCLLHEKPWKGYGDLSGNYWYRLQRSAKKRNWEFDIDIKFAWELFLKQNKKCSLSNRKLHMEVSYLNPRNKETPRQTASLDRIDSTKGYLENNVQWIHVDINYMKQEMDQNHFIEMCREITEWHQKFKN